jgi:hypothetical protein
MVNRGFVWAPIFMHLIGSALIAAGQSAIGVIAGIISILGALGLTLAAADWLMGSNGLDITIDATRGLAGIIPSRPTVERQQGVWHGDRKICDNANIESLTAAFGKG